MPQMVIYENMSDLSIPHLCTYLRRQELCILLLKNKWQMSVHDILWLLRFRAMKRDYSLHVQNSQSHGWNIASFVVSDSVDCLFTNDLQHVNINLLNTTKQHLDLNHMVSVCWIVVTRKLKWSKMNGLQLGQRIVGLYSHDECLPGCQL